MMRPLHLCVLLYNSRKVRMVLVRQERGLLLKNRLNIVLLLDLGMVLSYIRILGPLTHQNKPFEMQQVDLFLRPQES